MELTHTQAREMIQFSADSALSANSLQSLKSHLASCKPCRTYADSIHAMEIHLRNVMRQHWNLRPAPLAVDAIKSKSFNRLFQPAQLATRFTMIATIALMVVVAALGMKNASREGGSNQAPVVVPLIPTPSLQTTSTEVNTVPPCEEIRYVIQPNDTLEGIALKFSVAKDDLMEANAMNSETIIAGGEIIVLVCNSTPTGTVRPPAFTTTITPLTDALSQTPDG